MTPVVSKGKHTVGRQPMQSSQGCFSEVPTLTTWSALNPACIALNVYCRATAESSGAQAAQVKWPSLQQPAGWGVSMQATWRTSGDGTRISSRR